MSPRLLRLAALVWLAGVWIAPVVRAAAATPPAPASHFNDYANFVPVDRGRAIDARLAQFERDTSTQLVVAIYPRLPDGVTLENYTVRTAQSWGVGQKKRDNGAVLFVFVADRSLRIEVGYGLEGSLTDAVAHSIIENELKPNLRAGRTGDALDAAVNAMITATKGEYRGSGRTSAEQSGASHSASVASSDGNSSFVVLFWIIAVIFIVGSLFRKGFIFQNPDHGDSSNDFWGGWSGGGGSSGDDGFSGGGGSFGGGGASGKW